MHGTKCKGIDCPIKLTCVRYTSKPSIEQDYFEESPYKDGECKYWWDRKLRASTWIYWNEDDPLMVEE
jgi:hypothetical protein